LIPVIAVAVPAVLLGSGSAGAATASTTAVSAAPMSNAAALTTLPNSNIVKNKTTGVYHYHPTKLATVFSGPYQNPLPACTATAAEATVFNKSGVTQKVLVGTKVVATILKGHGIYVCFWGSGSHVFRYGLMTGTVLSTSHLAITVT
jgi:hypothetical protein